MARHVRAMLALRERGAVVFDYGNNIRPHAAGAGVDDALIDRHLHRPLPAAAVQPRDRSVSLDLRVGRRRRSRRWSTTSARSCSPTCPRIADWIELARDPRSAPGAAGPDRLARPRRARPAGAGGQRRRRRRPARRAGRVHPRPHGLGLDDPPEHHQRGDGRRLRRGLRLAAAQRAAEHRVRRRPGRAPRGRRRLRRLLAERRDDGRRDRHR